MAQASTELRAIADAAYGAINAGDLDALIAVVTEDVEFTSLVAEVEGATFRGHDGIRAWWEMIRGVFEEIRWEVLDMQGSGNRGVACVRLAGTISGIPLEQTMWQAVEMRDGKASWWAFFRTEPEALEAARILPP
jgi:ketosteroid isomerase-like protein